VAGSNASRSSSAADAASESPTTSTLWATNIASAGESTMFESALVTVARAAVEVGAAGAVLVEVDASEDEFADTT